MEIYGRIYDRGLDANTKQAGSENSLTVSSYDKNTFTGTGEDDEEHTLDIIVNYGEDEIGDDSQDRVYMFDNIEGSRSFTMLSPKALPYYDLPEEYAGIRHENGKYCNLTIIGKGMWSENWDNLLVPIADRPARTKEVIKQRKRLLEKMLDEFTDEYRKYRDALIIVNSKTN